MQLKDKTIIVTGGGTGVGKCVAQTFVNAGAQVVITGRRGQVLDEVCAEMIATNASASIKSFAADMSDRAAVKALVEFTNTEFGPVDILVSNAGTNIANRKLDAITPEDWDLVMNVNATGAFNITQAVLPQMREKKDGVIISISSVAGVQASVLAGAAYNASKHAMTAYTKTISLEEKDNGIRATAIHPGEINTPILDRRAAPPPQDAREVMLQPEDIAAACLFVATLHPRANVPDMIIKPTNYAFA